MRVVVTGGTGFGGRHGAELARRGDRMTVLSRAPRDTSARPGVDFVEWQPDSLDHLLRGADSVVYLMGSPAAGLRWALAGLAGHAGGSRC